MVQTADCFGAVTDEAIHKLILRIVSFIYTTLGRKLYRRGGGGGEGGGEQHSSCEIFYVSCFQSTRESISMSSKRAGASAEKSVMTPCLFFSFK